MIGLTAEQRTLFPASAMLEDYQRHCEVAHDATRADYRKRVSEWHKEHFPECTWRALSPK